MNDLSLSRGPVLNLFQLSTFYLKIRLKSIKLFFFFISLSFLFSCSMTKGLEEGERLHATTNFRFINPERVPHKGKVESELRYIAKPAPAAGLAKWQVGLYQSINKKEKDKGLAAWVQKKLGKPPVLYDENKVERSRLVMENHLHDIGHFGARIEMDTLVKGKKVTVNYAVTSRGEYSVRNFHWPKDTLPIIHLILENKEESLIDTGQPYRQLELTQERIRLANMATNHGFYEVNQDNFFYFVDTTAGNREVDVFLRLRQTGDSSIYQIYHLGNTTVYPDFSLETDASSSEMDTLQSLGLRIVRKGEQVLRPSVLNRLVWQDEGAVFSKSEQRATINRLLNLGIFKFANIRFDRRLERDTFFLDRQVMLTPGQWHDVGVQFEVNSRSGNFLGTELAGSFTNKNTFRGGELLDLSLSTGVETNIGANSNSFINTLNIGAKASLELPGIYAPFVDRKRVRGEFLPRTTFSVGDDFQSRPGFFALNSFNLSAGYRWRKKDITHNFQPFFVNQINTLETSDKLDALLAQNSRLRASFENVFIGGAGYSLSFDHKNDGRQGQHFFFQGGVETVGHLLDLLSGGGSQFIGLDYAQYVKFDFDIRQYFPLRKGELAGRAFFGIGVPHGNSNTLPYIKQYFIGGASSVRAFRIRTLGPGGFESKVGNDGSNFVDQTGDLKLELNLEYRFPMVSFLEGAVFVDGGNIWLLRGDADESTLESDGRFGFDTFYSEIAIGTGFGFRLDFDVVVVRLDGAFPIRKPSETTGTRWQFDKLDFGNRDWRRQNVVWNIAIGYPF